MSAFIDLKGQVFGRWTVIKRAKNSKTGSAQWVCQCVCGNQRIQKGIALRIGDSHSCGCLKREMTEQRNYKHGKSETVEYYLWKGMKQRVLDKKSIGYKNYGGRGITICDGWKNCFANFLADMGPRPGPQYTLERINNDGPYAPENVIWATRIEQQANRQKNLRLTFQGKTLTLAQWSRETGFSYEALTYRLSAGWDISRILTQPLRWSAAK